MLLILKLLIKRGVLIEVTIDLRFGFVVWVLSVLCVSVIIT